MSICVDDGSRTTARVMVYVDTAAEIASLKTTYAVGSVAFVINESKVYMLNNEKQWKEI